MLQSAILDGRDTYGCHSFQMFPLVSVVRGYRTQGIVLATVTVIVKQFIFEASKCVDFKRLRGAYHFLY